MKSKTISRKSGNLYIKIFGIPICKINFDNDIIKSKFLGGLIYRKKNRLSLEENIRIFGFSVYKKHSTDNLKYKSLYRILSKNKLNIHKHVFIFNGSPSGELYIVLNLINQIIKSISDNEILFVVDKNFKRNLCKLYFPNIKYYLNKKLNLFIKKKSIFKYKGVTFYSIFTTSHYLKQDLKINKENIHYYDCIYKDLGVNRVSKFSLPNISETVQMKIKTYIEKNNLENFVIISPEANTSHTLNRDFWNELCVRLKDRKYNVFLNIMKMENYIDDCYVNFFKYEELIEFAKYSKGLIGLRSGLIEILSTLDIPIHCLYSPFPKRGELQAMSSKKALIGFSLKKLPSVNLNKIYEYDTMLYSDEKLLNSILADFDKIHRL